MDIANVVFVCGRHRRLNDPSLEVTYAMYSNTVERFSFSVFNFLVLTWHVLFSRCACPTSTSQVLKSQSSSLLPRQSSCHTPAGFVSGPVHIGDSFDLSRTDEQEHGLRILKNLA